MAETDLGLADLRYAFWGGPSNERGLLQGWINNNFTADDMVFKDPATGDLVDSDGVSMDTPSALSGWGMVPNHIATSGATARAYDTAGRAYFNRTYGTLDISKVTIQVGTSSGNISIAAYTNSGVGRAGRPTGGQKATTGAIACPAAGEAEVSLGATVTQNDGDWYGFSCDNTTASFSGFGLGINVGDIWKGIGGYQNSAHPCPATPALTGHGMANHVYMIGIA